MEVALKLYPLCPKNNMYFRKLWPTEEILVIKLRCKPIYMICSESCISLKGKKEGFNLV